MKKKIIILSIVILVLIIISSIFIYNESHKEEKKFIGTWNGIEKDFSTLNDILIKFDKDNDKLYRVLYVYDNEIISNMDSNIKVSMTEEEKDMFIKLLEYYKENLSAESENLDYIYIYDNYIVYRSETGYFGIIYSMDGNSHIFRKDLDVYHIKGNWYFQTIRYAKEFK